MDAIPNDQMQKRAESREQCSRAVSRLLQAINSQLKAAYPRDELTNLGVSLEPFDPNDQEFVNSKACLFKPLSSEALEKYSLVESEFCGGALDYYFEFDELYHHPTNMKNVSSSYIMAERADQIFNHLEILHKHYEIKNGKDLEFLDEVSGWDGIK